MKSRFVLLVGVLLAPGVLHAQLPGDPLVSSRTSFRQEYLDHTYKENSKSIAELIEAVERGDPKRIKKLVSEELLFSPLAGWVVRGTEAVDSLATFLPRVTSLGISPFDFDASGGIVDAAIVLIQRGDTWKVRSYVERPRPGQDR